VVVGALLDNDRAVGLVITIEDVTARLERERQLARRLRAADTSERLLAVSQLAELEATEGLGPIEWALEDEDWHVRRTAVQALARRRDAPLVNAVVAALREGHRNFSLLSSALQLLSVTGLDVTDALISLMGNPDADVRIQAALALGGQRRQEAAEALVAAFDDPDVNVRFHAIEAIGRKAYPAAIDRLADIATSGDFFLAFPAVASLVRIGDPLVVPRLAPLLDDDVLAAAAAEALGSFGDEDAVAFLVDALNSSTSAVAPIVEALVRIHERYRTLFSGGTEIEDVLGRTISAAGTRRVLGALPDATGETLKHFVVVLGWMRDPAIPAALTRVLGSAGVRHEIIETFVRFGTSAATLLIEQLRAEDAEAKRSAIVALARMGDSRAVPSLVEVLLSEDEREVWVSVCGALARLGDERAFEALLSKLGDEDAAVRQAAIGALNSIGHPAMGARMASMIVHPSPLVRESAVRIAGYFGYAECMDAAFARCHDQDETVRAAALEHLPYFDSPRAIEVLAAALSDDTPRARSAAAHALGSIEGPRARRLLAQALADSESWVRYFAAISLGRHGDASAIEALGTLARSDAAVHVSVAAIDAVAAIGGDGAVEELAAVARDPGDRGQAAVRALGRVRSDRTVDTLREALRSGASPRRLIAVEALATHATPEVVEDLAWTSTADADPQVARAAVAALRDVANQGGAAGPRAVEALVETLRDPDRRAEVLDALARLTPSALPHLTNALGVGDPHIRRGVVEALGRQAHSAASACLRRALSDEDAVVRRTAIAALARVGARGLGARLTALAQTDPSPFVRQAAAAALHRSDALASPGSE
jgi:HEAT repeat protein